MSSIYTRLKELRKKYKFSQKDIESKIGITQAAYSSLENGHSEMSLSTLKKIIKLYSISADELIFGEKNNENPDNFGIPDFVTDLVTKEVLKSNERQIKTLEELTEAQKIIIKKLEEEIDELKNKGK